jgi:hypothetical protein
MRIQFPVSIVAVLAAASLAACASGSVRSSVAEGGEVALAPVAAASSRATTFAPITLDELGEPVATVSTAGRRLAMGLAAPAVASRSAAPAEGAAELWRGTYVGRTYGQKGAIALALRPVWAGVRGTVAWRVTSAPARLGRTGADTAALVRAPVVSATRDSGQLVLRLDSYFDPSCNCTARATFRGTIRGDTLVGRFSVEGPATVVSEERGYWRAVRVTP